MLMSLEALVEKYPFVPLKLLQDMRAAWNEWEDYRGIGLCAAVAFIRLLGRNMDLLPPDEFLELIFEYINYFDLDETSITLKLQFDKKLETLEEILKVKLVLFNESWNCNWRETKTAIGNEMKKKGGQEHFLIYMFGESPHLFILVAEETECHVYDQFTKGVELPFHSKRICLTYRVVYDSP